MIQLEVVAVSFAIVVGVYVLLMVALTLYNCWRESR
jgi:hypothetical protein